MQLSNELFFLYIHKLSFLRDTFDTSCMIILIDNIILTNHFAWFEVRHCKIIYLSLCVLIEVLILKFACSLWIFKNILNIFGFLVRLLSILSDNKQALCNNVYSVSKITLFVNILPFYCFCFNHIRRKLFLLCQCHICFLK